LLALNHRCQRWLLQLLIHITSLNRVLAITPTAYGNDIEFPSGDVERVRFSAAAAKFKPQWWGFGRIEQLSFSDTKHRGTFRVTDDEDLLGVRDNVKNLEALASIIYVQSVRGVHLVFRNILGGTSDHKFSAGYISIVTTQRHSGTKGFGLVHIYHLSSLNLGSVRLNLKILRSEDLQGALA